MAENRNTGVSNPYALAELVSGRKIDWKNISDRPRLLEKILQTPYNQLFDPVFNSPLYLGLELTDKLTLQRRARSSLNTDSKLDSTATESVPLKKIGDLEQYISKGNIKDIDLLRANVLGEDVLQLEIPLPEKLQNENFFRLSSKDLLELIIPNRETHGVDTSGWNPTGVTWASEGRFFNQAAEFFDPVQGVVADCYLIAALASIAWARPYLISHRTRATGSTQRDFRNMIPIHDDNVLLEVEVGSAIPLAEATRHFINARSSEDWEIWPAIYEKAYAKWLTGTDSAHPDITQLALGDTWITLTHLTGLPEFVYETIALTADQLWEMVQENSAAKRTINPMATATYQTSAATPTGASFTNSGLVAAHAYSVLGWEYKDNKRYIILRNPWGIMEPNLGAPDHTIIMFDVSWWRPISLT